MTGDFAIAFLRVMPHAAEPERLEKNLAAMKEVKAVTLSEHLGQAGRNRLRRRSSPHSSHPMPTSTRTTSSR